MHSTTGESAAQEAANLVPLHRLRTPKAGIDIHGPRRFPQPTSGPIDFYLGE